MHSFSQTNKGFGSSLGPLKTETLAPLRGQLGSSLPSPVGALKPLNGSLGTTLGDTKGIQSSTNKSLGSLKPVDIVYRCSYNFNHVVKIDLFHR